MRTVVLLLVCVVGACKPSDILSVPAPTGVLSNSSEQNQSGAELIAANAMAELNVGFAQWQSGVLEWSGLLADEFQWTDVKQGGQWAGVDARVTEAGRGFVEVGDISLEDLILARVTFLTALPMLERYEPASGRPKIGLAFALVGYSELLIAEDYCAGLPLAAPTPNGFTYGMPLTTDSMLGVAEAHFDSAVAYAGTDTLVGPLAATGLGRTRLDRGDFATAAAAVAEVPTSFIYNAELEPGGYNNAGLTSSNAYDYGVQNYNCSDFTTADSKGRNGLNYISANDPRLVFDTTLAETCDGLNASLADSVYHYPMKFGFPSTNIPLATGAEARLVEAEAALHAGQVATWAADLNALRASAPGTYLALSSGMPPLTTDSTIGATEATQVAVMFRERAFWLYGTGSRLGDMRRLIRQYGRDQSTVFPIGPYPNASLPGLPSALPSYGTEVNLTLPTAAGGLPGPQPNYRGCISRAA